MGTVLIFTKIVHHWLCENGTRPTTESLASRMERQRAKHYTHPMHYDALHVLRSLTIGESGLTFVIRQFVHLQIAIFILFRISLDSTHGLKACD